MTRAIPWGLALVIGAVVASCGGDSYEFDGRANLAGHAGLGSGAKGGAGGSGATGGSSATGSSGGTGGSGATGGSGVGGGSGASGSSTGAGGAGRSAGGSGGNSPSAGRGGTGGNAAGGSHAGEAGEGGSPAGGGGAGSNPSECPALAPTNGASCPTEGSCIYVGTRCDCAGRQNDMKWRCRGSGAACPPNAPVASSACESDMGMPLDCPYPDGSECRCDRAQWKCDAAPAPPGAGGAPDMPGPGGPGPQGPAQAGN